MYLIIFFLLGTILSSFYNIIGNRLPVHEPIFKTTTCTYCSYQHRWYENINLLYYFLNSGRCRNCHKRLNYLPMLNEIFTGILFAFSYYIFGFSYELLIAFGIISLLMIIIVSDLNYMIIPDEVLIFFNAYFIIIIFMELGFYEIILRILSGFFLFGVMYLIMIIGNFIFKKESLGGGDIKMMFTFGLILGPIVGIFSIFLGSLLALPISILIMKLKKDNLIPFGPFLLVALAFLFFTGIDYMTLINFFNV